MSQDLVTRKLTAWKDALIDLTKRNPLLSLPTRSVIPLNDAPDQLWELPAQGSKRLCFVSEKIPGTEIRRELKARDRAVDATSYRTLNSLRLKSRLSLNEQGVNSLFIAVGVLEWSDPGLGSTVRSPILLLPVNLERSPEGDGFLLGRFEDEPRLNPTLRFRLSKSDVNFDLSVPEDSLDDGFSPSAYLASLAVLVAKRPGWRVAETECLLGRFSFLNLVMYEELDQRMDDLRRHPLIAAIAGDVEQSENLRLQESQLYPEVPLPDTEPPQMAYHVLPADPSQEKAILAARYNRSLVIQGPPGTGKTQTITNLIATCIADGKRVLFVSEKMAALEAVYKRLQAHGLADLCLEAHSHKASKHEVMEQLRRALEETIKVAKVNPAELSVMTTLRDGFHQSVEALHRPREPLGISVYEARGRVARLAGVPDVFFALDQVEETDNDLYHQQEQLAERLAAFHDLFGRIDDHPWRGIKAERYTQEVHTRVRDTVNDLLKVTDALEEETESLWRVLGLPDPQPDSLAIPDTDWLSDVSRQLQAASRPPVPWLTGTEEHLAELRRLAMATRDRFRAFTARRNSLLKACLPEVLEMPHDELIQSLTSHAEPTLRPAFSEGWADVSDGAFAVAERTSRVAGDAAQRLLQSAGRLAQQCGLPPPQTLTQNKANENVARLTLHDPRPLAHWLIRDTCVTLARQRGEAQALHQQHRSERNAVAETYAEAIYQLDLEGLLARFQNEYASWTRVFKGGYHRDRKTLSSVLLPGTSLKGRDPAEDLRRACKAKELKRQLDGEAPVLQAAFAARYRGEETDWSELQQALDQTNAIVASLGGSVPTELADRLVRSGAGIAELREQHQLVAEHLDACEKALTDVAANLRIPGSDAQPVSQLTLPEVVANLLKIREEIASYVAVRQRVRAVHLSPDAAASTLCELLREARQLVEQERAIAQESTRLREEYAHLFQGLETDWETVLIALDDAERLRRIFAERKRPFPQAVLAAASGAGEEIVYEAAQAEARIRPLRRELDRVSLELLALFDQPAFATYAVQREWAEVRLGALTQLERWLAFQSARRECGKLGLLSFSEVMIRRCPPAAQIPAIFARAFHQRWLDAVTARAPELNTLSAAEYVPLAAKFSQLDRRLIAVNANRVKANARERRELVQTTATRTGEVAFLQKILKQKRPRASVRKILAEIPNLLFRLKPCLMMSPLSVSLFLDPDRIQFDIVIFDEASQIFPEYALGPLLRAGQAVIAGDSKQLPPTSFFKGMQDSDGEEDDEEAQASDAREYESILNAAAAVLSPDREFYLTWHYRSKHESLIDFSRRHFYESRLATFPSSRQATAVSFEYVPGAVYYGGKGKPRNNPAEAERVAALVDDYVRKHPGRSVGVITMSEAQQDCIRAAIEKRTMLDSTLASLLNEDKPDGFFVKNIENVQGDERDAIFLSIGYGKWEDGRARMLFGPINRDGGGRRLNVAVTRAREHVTVISSLLPEEIRLADTASEGARLLQAYLSYARSASLAGVKSSTETDDSLVEAVAQALEARGHSIQRQVGLSEYHVDLAVRDPENPERFVLGIECDSENYTSGETVRAREWLRADVLKSLGWRLHRLWSADWIRDPAKALESLERAIAHTDAEEPLMPPVEEEEASPHSEPESHEEEPPTAASAAVGGPLPGLSYFSAAQNLTLPGGTDTLYGEYQHNAIARAEFVYSLVRAEGPVSIPTVAVRLCRAAGLSRAGKQIQRIADASIALLSNAGKVEEKGGFLWLEGMEDPPARIPAPGAEPRPIEQIAPEELEKIVYAVLRNGIGMRLEELTTETARVLGYGTTGSAIRERIEAAIGSLEYDNQIHNFNGQLRTFEVA